MIAVVLGIILSMIGNFLSTAEKQNRQKFEHNRPGPSLRPHIRPTVVLAY